MKYRQDNFLVYKILLIGLLFLISLSLVFTKPGVGTLETFHKYTTSQEEPKTVISIVTSFIKYPPSVSFVFKSILNTLPIDQSKPLFHNQNAWIAYKLILFAAYIITWVTFLSFFLSLRKSTHQTLKIHAIDISIAYLGSVLILLSSLALSHYEILAAPFLILCLSYLFQKKFATSGIFYLLSLTFNLTFLVFAPFLLLAFRNSKKNHTANSIIPIFSFVAVPLTTTILITSTTFLNPKWLLSSTGRTLVANIPGLLNQAFSPLRNYMETHGSIWPVLASALIATIIFVITSRSILQHLLSNYLKQFEKTKSILILFIPISLLALTIIWPNSSIFYIFLLILFILLYYKIYRRFCASSTIPTTTNILALFSSYLALTIFLPNISEGNLLWLAILSLALYIVQPSSYTLIQLLLINILTFTNLFIFFGAAGTEPVKGLYFSTFRSVLMSGFALFSAWYLTQTRNNLIHQRASTPQSTNTKFTWMKKFIIVYLVLFNLALIPAQGSSDTVSWSQYSNAVIKAGGNPFLAQTLEDQRYPPLSTVILGTFTNLWQQIVGLSKTYAIATKISIFVFYFLTIFLYIRLSTHNKNKGSLGNSTKLLVCLTTFSLIIQTQGLADLNIYVIPPLIISIIALYKKKYLLGGLLLGIAISIKWQPVILLPLFGATLFTLSDKLIISLRRTFIFALGLAIPPLISWGLVLIQPDGPLALKRATDYLLQGAPMLSGQALNLNWIVTYAIHIFQPELDVSLKHLGGLNRQVPTGIAPSIFQGYLFIATVSVILLRYWLLKNKSLVQFMSAAVMIFFSHHILNKSAYEKHLLYTVVLMLFLYLIRPTDGNKKLLVLFDIMVVMNLIFFYGFTGPKDINRLFFGFDVTVAFAAYYVIIFAWVFWRYLRGGLLFEKEKT